MGLGDAVWLGLGTVGLWAVLDAFGERTDLPDVRCVSCRTACVPARFCAFTEGTEYSTLQELEDLRHLYVHNYGGEADDTSFNATRGRHVIVRHVLAPNAPVTLVSGGSFDGHRVHLNATNLQAYSADVRRVLNRVR